MTKIKKICDYCKIEFEKPDYYFRNELKKNPDHKWFCSHRCVYAYKTILPKIKTQCRFCQKEIELDINAFSRRKDHFCNKICYVNQRNIGKTKKQLVCPTCKTLFENTVNQINGKRRKGAKSIFCSSHCSSQAQRTDASKDFVIKCDHCGNDTTKTGRQLKITKIHFCSPNCKGSYFAKLYALGAKRSRLELKIEEYLKQCFPDLAFIVNDREVLKGLELDFYFPMFNFAIEVNGPAHFTPIYGDESFLRTRRNDIIKKNYCRKKRIRLLEITDTLHPYTDNSKEIFDQYVSPIIKDLTLLTTV